MPPTIVGSPRRSMANIETRIKAIKSCYVDMRPVKEVVTEIYGKSKPPKNAGMVLSSWRRSLIKKINDGDKKIIEACKKAGIYKED